MIPKFTDLVASDRFSELPAEDKQAVVSSYWDDFSVENPGTEDFVDEQRDLSASYIDARRRADYAAPVEKRLLDERARNAAVGLAVREGLLAGDLKPEDVPRVLASQQNPQGRKLASLFDPEVDAEMQPAWDALTQRAAEAGAFGPQRLTARREDVGASRFLPMGGGPLRDAAREGLGATGRADRMNEYRKLRDELATDFGLEPDEVDDVIKHRMGLQEKPVSRDAFGTPHFKPDLLTQDEATVAAAIRDSDLPDPLKDQLQQGLGERLSKFRQNTVARLEADMPELRDALVSAGELRADGTTEEKFEDIVGSLNKNVWSQGMTGFTSGVAATAEQLGKVGELIGIDTEGGYDAETRQKALNDFLSLSTEFNKNQVDILGTDASTFGQGAWSALESVALGRVTSGVKVFPASVMSKFSPQMKGFAEAVNRGASVSPQAGLAAAKTSTQTYRDAKEAGMSDDQATALARRSGAIEFFVTTMFSGIGQGGLEEVGKQLNRNAVKQAANEVTQSLGKRILGGLSQEVAEELTITAIDSIYVQSKINPEFTTDDFQKALKDTLAATIATAGPMVALGEVGRKAAVESSVLATKAQDGGAEQSGTAALEIGAPMTTETPNMGISPVGETAPTTETGQVTPLTGQAAVGRIEGDERPDDGGAEVGAEGSPTVSQPEPVSVLPETPGREQRQPGSDRGDDRPAQRGTTGVVGETGGGRVEEIERVAEETPERVFYRGTTEGDARRIDEPFTAAKGLTFVARQPASAQNYGASVERIAAKPEAKILREEDAAFWRLIGRKRPPNNFIGSAGRDGETMVDVVNDAITKAKEAGYDIISFASDSDIGTIVLNEAMVVRETPTPETPVEATLPEPPVSEEAPETAPVAETTVTEPSPQPEAAPTAPLPEGTAPPETGGAEVAPSPATQPRTPQTDEVSQEQGQQVSPEAGQQEVRPQGLQGGENEVRPQGQEVAPETPVPDEGAGAVAADIEYANLVGEKRLRDARPLVDRAAGVPDVFDAKNGVGQVPNNQEIGYMGFRLYLKPSEFRALVPRGVSGPKTKTFVVDHLRSGGKIGQPFLQAKWDGETNTWKVVDHEGRSRADAFQEVFGDAPMEVHVFPWSGKARDMTDEMKRANWVGQNGEGRLTYEPRMNADTVVIDDQGAVVPLSERFNETRPKSASGIPKTEAGVREQGLPPSSGRGAGDTGTPQETPVPDEGAGAVAETAAEQQLNEERPITQERWDATPVRGRVVLLAQKVGRELERQAVERGLATVDESGRVRISGYRAFGTGQLVARQEVRSGRPGREGEVGGRVLDRPPSVVPEDALAGSSRLAARLGYDPAVLEQSIKEAAASPSPPSAGVEFALKGVVGDTEQGDGLGGAPQESLLRGVTPTDGQDIGQTPPETPPTDKIPTEPPPLPGGRQMPQEGDTYGVKVAKLNESLARMGQPPLNPGKFGGREDSLARAFETLERDPDAARKLANKTRGEFDRGGSNAVTPYSGDDWAVINVYKAQQEVALADKTREWFNENSSGNRQVADELWGDIEDQEEAVREFIANAALAGSAGGNSFRAMQDTLAEDFSLEGLTRSYRKQVKNGEPLTKEETATLAEAAEALEREQNTLNLMTLADEMEKAGRTKESAALVKVAELIDSLQKEVAAERKRPISASKRRDIKKRLSTAAENAKKRLEAAGVYNLGITPQPESPFQNLSVIKDAATLMGAKFADKLIDGTISIQEFTLGLIESFGEAVRPYSERIYEETKKLGDSLRSPGAEPVTPEQIIDSIDRESDLDRKDVWALAKAHVAQGKTGSKVMDAVLDDLKPLFPDLTREQVVQEFTDYGVIQKPNPETTAKELRRIKQLELEYMKLLDIERGELPKRTGRQRDETDADVRQARKETREKLRELEDKMREAGIEVPSDAQRQKTALQSLKRMMENEIAERKAAIVSGKPIVTVTRNGVVMDEDAADIRKRLEEIRTLYDEVFPKEKITHEEQIERAMKALDKQIANEEKMLRDGVTERPRTQPLVTPELEAKRQRLADLREKRRALDPNNSPLAQAIRARRAANEKLEQRLKTDDLAVRRRQKVEPDAVLQDLIEVGDALRAEIRERRKLLPESPSAYKTRTQRELQQAEKRLAEVERMIEEGDIAVRKSPSPKVTDPAVSKVRNKIKEANKRIASMRREAMPEEERAMRYAKPLDKRTADLERRIREKDYSPLTKKARPINHPIADEARARHLDAVERHSEFIFQKIYERQNFITKAFKNAIDIGFAVPKAVMASGDASGFGKQGLKMLMAHPLVALKAYSKNFYYSHKSANAAAAALRQRENYPLYLKMGLQFKSARDGQRFRDIHEAYQSRLSKKIPILGKVVGWSENGYTTFLNQIMADAADVFLANAKNVPGSMTEDNLKMIADHINMLSGTSSFRGFEHLGPAFGTILWAPKFLFSQFEAIKGITYSALDATTGFRLGDVVDQKLKKRDSSTRWARKALAADNARMVGGYVAMGIMFKALTALYNELKGEDDDEMEYELDMRSTDFGKLKIGDTRYDFGGGMLQALVFGAREITGKVKKADGTIENIADTPGFADQTRLGLAWRFARSKLGPSQGTVVNMLQKTDFLGNPYYWESELVGNYVPLPAQELYESYRQGGMSHSLARTALSFHGFTSNRYGDETDARYNSELGKDVMDNVLFPIINFAATPTGKQIRPNRFTLPPEADAWIDR